MPMPLLAPSPKSMAIPAEAQNFTVSGARPEVGEARNRAGAAAAETAGAKASTTTMLAVAPRSR